MKRRVVVILAVASLGGGGTPPPKPKLATGFIFPVDPDEGYGIFGYSHFECDTELGYCHAGEDWGLPGEADHGKKFRAAANGLVKISKWGGAWGYHILIEHELPDGTRICSHYAHCDKLLVQAGGVVEIGQVIGTIGKTGNAFGTHLHLEIVECGANNPLFDYTARVGKAAQYLNPSLFISDRQNVEEISADPMLNYFGLGLVYFQVTRPVPSATMFFEVGGEAVGLAEAVNRGWVNESIYIWRPSEQNGRWITDPATEERTFDPEAWYYFFVSFPASGATVNFHLPAYYLVRERAFEESLRLARNYGQYEKVDLRSFRLENFSEPGWVNFDRYVLTLLEPTEADWPSRATVVHATYLPEPSWRWFTVLFPDLPEFFDQWYQYETVVPY